MADEHKEEMKKQTADADSDRPGRAVAARNVSEADGASNSTAESPTANPESRGRFRRREMLKVMTSVPAAALIPIAPAMAEKPKSTHAHPASTQAEAKPAGPYQPKVLTPHEWKMINVLSDVIIPADERSGSATQAGVPEYIDDWLSFRGWGSGGGRRLLPQIRGGLTWLDVECNRQFGKDFVDCSQAQQKEILDRIAYPKRAAPEDAAGVAFFNQLRGLVVSGFFSSKMGVQDLPFLGNAVVPEWEGCPPKVLAKLGLQGEGKS